MLACRAHARFRTYIEPLPVRAVVFSGFATRPVGVQFGPVGAVAVALRARAAARIVRLQHFGGRAVLNFVPRAARVRVGVQFGLVCSIAVALVSCAASRLAFI